MPARVLIFKTVVTVGKKGNSNSSMPEKQLQIPLAVPTISADTSYPCPALQQVTIHNSPEDIHVAITVTATSTVTARDVISQLKPALNLSLASHSIDLERPTHVYGLYFISTSGSGDEITTRYYPANSNIKVNAMEEFGKIHALNYATLVLVLSSTQWIAGGNNKLDVVYQDNPLAKAQALPTSTTLLALCKLEEKALQLNQAQTTISQLQLARDSCMNAKTSSKRKAGEDHVGKAAHKIAKLEERNNELEYDNWMLKQEVKDQKRLAKATGTALELWDSVCAPVFGFLGPEDLGLHEDFD